MRYVALQLVMLASLVGASVTGAGPALKLGAEFGAWTSAVAAFGTLVMATALLLALWAIAWLRRSLAATPAPRAGARFVARGPYRWMRHPMYTSLLLLALGLLLRRPTLFTLVAALGLAAVLALKVRHEEGLLLARYPEYAAYRARTWGLVPRPFARRARGVVAEDAQEF